MKILALDVSTKTGWALKEGAQLVAFGLIEKSKPAFKDYGKYPENFNSVALDVAEQMWCLILKHQPDRVVIEEINKTGRFGSRFSQRLLDSIHCMLIQKIVHGLNQGHWTEGGNGFKELLASDVVFYINTSDWRKKLNLSVSETKKLAKPYLKELARLKAELAKADKSKKTTLKIQLEALKKELKDKCIHGKIDKKSISVAYVNLTFKLNLKKGDNDISDAICLVEAYQKGVKTLTNKDIFEQDR